MDNSINLVVGYAVAAALYLGFTAYLLLRRRSLAALLSDQTDNKD